MEETWEYRGIGFENTGRRRETLKGKAFNTSRSFFKSGNDGWASQRERYLPEIVKFLFFTNVFRAAQHSKGCIICPFNGKRVRWAKSEAYMPYAHSSPQVFSVLFEGGSPRRNKYLQNPLD